MNATPLTRERATALAAFFVRYERSLTRIVAAQVWTNDPEIIDDACAFGWLHLTRHTGISLDRQGFSWLTTVAIHEGWRMHRERRDIPVGGFLPGRPTPFELAEPEGTATDPLERALDTETQRERVARFACLKPRERRDLGLFALGYKYQEIAALTESSYTAVNRRIREGRTQLRCGSR